MSQFKSHLWVTVAVLLLAFTIWLGNRASVAVRAQDFDRVLEIETYPDEPLQLVNLRIGTQSVKDSIKQKFRDSASKWGTDSVKFKEKDDWFKRVTITLRNTSDKPVYGVSGFLFFKPLGFPMIFSLTLTNSKALHQNPLQPGEEIELTVSPGMLNHTLEDLKDRGADVTNAAISFSLDKVIFSDDLQWYRGKVLRPDTAVPGKWVPVDQPVAVNNRKQAGKTGSFVQASFKSVAPAKPAAPVVFTTCKKWNGSVVGFPCNNDLDDCIRRVDLDDDPLAGKLSQVSVSGLCEDSRNVGLVCHTSTVHTRYQTDPGCPCPDNDQDGYRDKACGGDDCNDNNDQVHPNAFEGPFWEAGGGVDCYLCQDEEDNDCDGQKDIFDDYCFGWCPGSPVLIDVSGNGFDLTNAANGVEFDLNNDGIKERLSWTVPQTDDAWLALDRNGDGAITSGTELFGNFTQQPNPPIGMGRNGFNALAEYDKPAKGGNSDGLITGQDAVFGKLLLWQDTNHNGISEANELRTLNQLGLTAIECDYKESKRKDQYGNQFRYRAKVRDMRDTRINRWAWDVFLVRDPTTSVLDNMLGLVKPKTIASIRTCSEE